MPEIADSATRALPGVADGATDSAPGITDDATDAIPADAGTRIVIAPCLDEMPAMTLPVSKPATPRHVCGVGTIAEVSTMSGSALAVDDSGIYTAGAGVLSFLPAAGGPKTIMSTTTDPVIALATTSDSIFLLTYLYPSRDGWLWLAAKGQPAMTNVSGWNSMGSCGSLTTWQGQAYWNYVSGSGGGVRRTSPTGETVSLTVETQPNGTGIAVMGGFVFWAGNSASVYAVPIEGGAARLVWTSYSPGPDRIDVRAIAAIPNTMVLFAATRDRVLRLEVDKHTTSIFFEGAAIHELAADDMFVYAATQDQVLRIPIEGGPAAVIADKQSGPSHLVPYGGNLFWLRGDGQVMSVARCGAEPIMPLAAESRRTCPPAEVIVQAPDHLILSDMVVADGRVHFSGGTSLPTVDDSPHFAGYVRSVPASGGPIAELWYGAGLARRLAADAAGIYFVTVNQGTMTIYDRHVGLFGMRECPLSAQLLGTGTSWSWHPGVALVGDQVFWTTPSWTDSVRRIARAGGDEVVFSDKLLESSSIAGLGGRVYLTALRGLSWIDTQDGQGVFSGVGSSEYPAVLAASDAGIFKTVGANLVRVDPVSGASAVLVDGPLAPSAITATSDAVYYGGPEDHLVYRVAITGGPPAVVACAELSTALAVDGQFLYIADSTAMTISRVPQ